MPTVTTRPQYLNANSGVYTAWDLRTASEHGPAGAGVAGYQDFRVIQRQAGANMSVDIGITGVGLMRAWVRGSTRGGQGLYAVDNIDRSAPTADTYVAQLNETVTGNASGNPRLDQVVLEVLDAQHAGASNLAQIRIVAGTATGGATLDNRTGAAALPASSILLADILVPNGAASIGTSDIRDRRQYALLGAPPTLLNNVDHVHFLPAPGLRVDPATAISHGNHDLTQSAALVYLPRRIVGATRIRWKYNQDSATAMTGNYNIGIYDASGRQIVTTGSVAWAGATNTIQVRSETISATTFEAGWYFIFMGLDSTAGLSYTMALAVQTAVGSSYNGGPMHPGAALVTASGGVTAPTTLLGFSNQHAEFNQALRVPVPLIALSVG